MNSMQFVNLQSINILDGLCYSLNYMIDELNDDVQDELFEKVSKLQQELQSFRNAALEYVVAHKDTYIDNGEM